VRGGDSAHLLISLDYALHRDSSYDMNLVKGFFKVPSQA
jgi:hypothetical protein